MIGGQVLLNGVKVAKRRVGDFSGSCETGHGCLVPQFEETYPGGKSVRILDAVTNDALDDTEVFTVPEDAYFVLGDNRDNSDDSRFNNIGFVPRRAIIGKVAYKYASGGHWVWQLVN